VRAVRVVVEGRVQGVGFRWSARRAAERIGVAGWVRNRPDGSVEAHVEGPDDRVQAMIAWLRQGPEDAVVSAVEAEETAVSDARGFIIEG